MHICSKLYLDNGTGTENGTENETGTDNGTGTGNGTRTVRERKNYSIRLASLFRYST